ncbi:MAG: 2-amino-4-hydroxy-6-hydroxymethyldihydropteridine diphosphokinase [Ferruginibacter sp.]
MNTVYLLLGSNLGNSAQVLADATKEIELQLGSVQKSSSLYRTAAWGYEDQPDFINQIIVITSVFNAATVLTKTQDIEKKLGRIRTFKNAARVIDIDILFFNSEIINTQTLTVPHPQVQNRRFVLIPLAEVAPLYQHPLLKKTPKELLLICPDNLNVQNI